MPECCSTVPNSAINPCILNEWNSNYEYLYFVSFCKYTKMNGTFLSFCFWGDMIQSNKILHNNNWDLLLCSPCYFYEVFRRIPNKCPEIKKIRLVLWYMSVMGCIYEIWVLPLAFENYKSLFYLNIVNFTTIWNILYFL